MEVKAEVSPPEPIERRHFYWSSYSFLSSLCKAAGG